MTRTGRRPGTPGTQDAIVVAARRHFAEVGYERATLRGIAAAAGVDAKLILHYFGSKEGVFRAAVAFPIDPAAAIPPLLEPGLDGLGTRVVAFFVATLESPASGGMLALIRSAVTREPAAALVREYVQREILARVAAPLQLDQPELRASLVASQLVGLAVVRYVVRLEPLASASPTTVNEWLGPTLQRYLTEPTPSSTCAETA
jgi:AcrR family transcriptional regulator